MQASLAVLGGLPGIAAALGSTALVPHVSAGLAEETSAAAEALGLPRPKLLDGAPLRAED
jgi:hypothetical protein